MGLTTQTYDILSRIAVGNGALVYRAVDKVSMRQVALKLLVQEGDLNHRLDVDALLADSPRLRKLAGAHVCQLLDAYPDDDGPVLVYEFAHGRSGQDFPSQRKLTPAEALDVAAQLMSALRSGERQKCPHGDVKPSNIVFVDLPDGRPFLVVLDWGLAAHRSAPPDDSLPFVAPERLAGGAASHAADLFSAGAVLFFLYTGKILAGGKTPGTLLAAWPHARPSMLAELRPDLPAKLVQWICSLLELDPHKRPPSAVEAGALLASMEPPPPPVPPSSIRPHPAAANPTSAVRAAPASAISRARSGVRPATTPGPKQVKSLHPVLNIAICVAIALAVCAGGWFAFFHRRDSAPAEIQTAENYGQPAPAREAAQSVGPPIGLPSQRTAGPAAKPAVFVPEARK